MSKESSGSNTTLLIHTAVEAVVLAGGTFLLLRRLAKAEARIFHVEEKLQQYEQVLLKHEAALARLMGGPLPPGPDPESESESEPEPEPEPRRTRPSRQHGRRPRSQPTARPRSQPTARSTPRSTPRSTARPTPRPTQATPRPTRRDSSDDEDLSSFVQDEMSEIDRNRSKPRRRPKNEAA